MDAAVKKINNLKHVIKQLEKKKQENLKSISKFGTESSFIRNSHLHPYESREPFIADQRSSSYNNNNFPIRVMGHAPQQVGFQNLSSPNFVLNICGAEAQFCMCTTKKPCPLTKIALMLEKYRIDVVSSSIIINENGHLYMILIQVKFKLNLSLPYS